PPPPRPGAVSPGAGARGPSPATLLILWLPVWARSSRLNSTRTPSSADSRGAPLTGVGRPAYSRSRPSSPARKPSSAQAARNSRSSSSHAGTRASGTNRPPNGPNRPAGPGSPMTTRSAVFASSGAFASPARFIAAPPSPDAGWPHLTSRVLEQYQTKRRRGSRGVAGAAGGLAPPPRVPAEPLAEPPGAATRRPGVAAGGARGRPP